MSFYDWNKKNDVISNFIGLKTQHETENSGQGLGCGGMVLLVSCVLLFCILLMLDCRIWVSALISCGIYVVVYAIAKIIYKRKKAKEKNHVDM